MRSATPPLRANVSNPSSLATRLARAASVIATASRCVASLIGGANSVAGDGKTSVRRRQALQLLIPVLDENEIA